jgi:hypothetical protein
VLERINTRCLVNQHHGNALNNVVFALQAWVVQKLVRRKVKQWTFVLRAGQDLEQLCIE